MLAEDQGVPASLVVNKSDLDPAASADAVAFYQSIGYRAFSLTATVGTGTDEVREYIGSRLVAVVGQSGVGKSTLLNALVGHEAQKVGQLSLKYGRGRHTTNAACLVSGEHMRIIDTPGVQDLEIRTVEPAALAWCFREFRAFSGKCRHGDCSHVDEPECRVRNAAGSGAIDGSRYETYRKFYDELLRLRGDHP